MQVITIYYVRKEDNIMDKNQKINCTVTSCKYNNPSKELCKLTQIKVEPIDDCETCECDESMCASYEYGTDEE